MKNHFLCLILIALYCINSSCTKSNFCNSTSQEAFAAFKRASEGKDLEALKALTSDIFNEYADYDLLFAGIDEPSIVFIEEDSVGAYGIKKMGSADGYYFDIKDRGEVKGEKVVIFKKEGDCYKIANITHVVESNKENDTALITNIEKENSFEPETFSSQKFMKKNLKIKKCLHSEKKCNFIQKHYLIENYNHNNDTLALAVEILTDSIYESVQFSDDCVKNIRCGVYLYKSSKDFEIDGFRNWFTMGSKITGEKAKIRFN